MAIARAIVTDPDLLIADEPTGDLDRKLAEQVLDLFEVLHHQLHKTLVMVTHDPHAAGRADLVRHLEKGLLQTCCATPCGWRSRCWRARWG